MAVSTLLKLGLLILRDHWLLLSLSFFLLRAVKRRYFSALSDVPALSFLSTISRLGKVREVLSGHTHLTQLKAHRKYGSILRIAPNEVSISDPAMIPIIYDAQQRFIKTDFYHIFGFPSPADKNIFSITDPAEYKRMKRNVGTAYSMTTFVGLEKYVDSIIELFVQRMTEMSVSASTPTAERGAPLNMVKWYQWFAFDLIGELSFSRRFGFLETKSDVAGMCKMLDDFIAYTSSVAMIPEMHKFLLGNPIIPYITKPPPAFIISDVAKQEIEKREADPSRSHSDFMSIIMDNQKRSTPAQFPHSELHRHASVNVTAGSESAGVTLDALTYYILKNPSVYAKLQAEVDAADAAGKLSDIPLYRETNHDAMPYLAACLKETMRIHPPVSLTLPRYVPKGGAVICGRFFPEGTRVGISAFTVGRDKKLFGEDADDFRPERWTECTREKYIEMENGCLHFSAGARTCIGRHIAILETCKLIPALLRKFRLELAEPDMEWEILNYTFLKPKSVNIYFVRRE